MSSLPSIPKHPLNDKFKRLRITRSQLAAHLSRPISTVSAWLNGYTPMPTDAESRLTALLSSLEPSDASSHNEKGV